MDTSITKKKKAVKSPKKGKSQDQLKYPEPVSRHEPIRLVYRMAGVCASLKNSQQVVPGNVKLVQQLDRLNDNIARIENKGAEQHDQLQVLRKEYLDIRERLVKSEDKARRNWLFQCERYKRWLDKILPDFRIWMDDMATQHGISFPAGHIRLRIIFYFPNLNRKDGPNKEQAIFDMLKAVNLVPDDTWTVIDDCHWSARLYRPRPRTEIYFTILDKDRSLWSDYLIEAKRRRRDEKGRRNGMTGTQLPEMRDTLE
jgi:hypothetical protein